MAEYANVKKSSVYSGLEPEHEYSLAEGNGDHHSDKGSSVSGGSDHGSLGRRRGSGASHDGSGDHGHHGARDGNADHSDREDDHSDREDRRSDREERRSAQSDREDGGHSDREDGRSDRSDREDGRSGRDSHSIHDREGSLKGSDHGEAGDTYEALDEMDYLVAQQEAAHNTYSNEELDRKSDASQSDDEEGGHGRRAVRRSDSAEGVRANAGAEDEAIYDEVGSHGSDSEGSEKGDRGHGRLSNDHYDDTGYAHARKNGHQRRGSHDSDDEEHHRSTVDGGVKRQTLSSAPTSSGKFVLRTSRKADPLHVLRHIRDSASAEDNPEMDELVTVLRSTDHKSKHDEVKEEEEQNEKIKSFLTSKLIHKFEGIALDDAFNEDHDDHKLTETPKISDQQNKTTVVKTTVGNTTVVKTTVGKTTVVKTTVRNDDAGPLSPRSFPKSPTTPTAAGSGPVGSGAHSDASRSSSSSSLSSASQIHQKPVTYESQMSNSGSVKSTSTTATGLHVTVTPTRHPTIELPKTPDDSSIPAWKTDIENRKKTRSHIPTQKPKEPMKLSEVPEWKKELLEKNKQKKLSSPDEPDITLARVTTVEMGRLKHEMVINHGHGGRGGDTLPEWARLADEKQKTISH